MLGWRAFAIERRRLGTEGGEHRIDRLPVGHAEPVHDGEDQVAHVVRGGHIRPRLCTRIAFDRRQREEYPGAVLRVFPVELANVVELAVRREDLVGVVLELDAAGASSDTAAIRRATP